MLAELAERLDPARLVKATARVARSDVQRLGWLLAFLGKGRLAEALENHLAGKRLVPVRLATDRSGGDAVLDPRWRVLINDDVEPDL